MKRNVFISFDYDNDAARVQQIIHIGEFDNTSSMRANKWEEVKYESDDKIQK